MKNVWLVLTVLILFSCKGTKITYVENSDSSFCERLKQINSFVEKDSVLIDYFSFLETDSLVFWNDTVVVNSIHPLFIDKISKIHSEKNNIDFEKAYKYVSSIYAESNSQTEKIITNCSENENLKKDCHVETVYWYFPNDNLFLIDIVEIIKSPQHRQGYFLLIGFDKENKIVIFDRSYWTE